ncbi:glycosyltransferase family 4 protein [Cellulomonas wangsupingiae]|uniref:D-inositol 3-phosphate glycosyltransferase n=1 Tax=Cellulomonas wangsupingiae TaxID=2968085 RepID=A0ABY5K9J3_9CELL|nr:glycosyltransferase family 4 protein [Cellulomonas wangsupingiae]MCC2333165.1 glycosyltransferase family 4 protein [Cellulomonas wangsupingiae]MCM0641343.1 glycosyltransferase family 4 protein [Cellulomonas wangsupingiae]UUI67010.1 glycosyltransferase family 4 protein [Cellulomonas wangsupingiae]
MRVGIVCPYSFDVPGGVQFHVRDLAESLIGRGHDVSVLAPAADDTPVPPYLVAAGRAVPVHYNGSVARLTFGPVTARRVRRWLAAGRFDVLHLHEPVTPSLGMLALWIADGPVVATFHTSITRSRSLQVAYPLVRQSLEKISLRIAVSEDARRTLVEHLGGDAVVIPNGVWVDTFADAGTDPRWTGTPQAPTVAFLGRLDEPRKGLAVLLRAVPAVLDAYPGARFLVAGSGETGEEQARELLGARAGAVEFLGSVSEQDKARLLASADVYCAPQTGGESFGIVLVEAMSAGTAVVASDLGAFARVLDDGDAGVLFRTGDSADLGATLVRVLADDALRARVSARASHVVGRYDWSAVTDQVLAVYEMAVAGRDAPVGEDPSSLRGTRLLELRRGRS